MGVWVYLGGIYLIFMDQMYGIFTYTYLIFMDQIYIYI